MNNEAAFVKNFSFIVLSFLIIRLLLYVVNKNFVQFQKKIKIFFAVLSGQLSEFYHTVIDCGFSICSITVFRKAAV